MTEFTKAADAHDDPPIPGSAVIAVLREAQLHFGTIDRRNREQVVRWVEQRCKALSSQAPAAPRDGRG